MGVARAGVEAAKRTGAKEQESRRKNPFRQPVDTEKQSNEMKRKLAKGAQAAAAACGDE